MSAYLPLVGAAISAAALCLTFKRSNLKMDLSKAPEALLIARSLWDECSGEPMNDEAEELERRERAALTSEPKE
jgi:hypothetical protein